MFGANVKTPFVSILNGPVVTDVTSVFAAVTATPFNKSFAVTFWTTVGVVAVGNVVGPSLMASIGLATITVATAVSQFAGVTFNPVVGLASHNW